MRVIRIVLIAFTFAFLAPGNSMPSRYPKAANIYPGFPSDSVKHRPEGTTDDFTGTGSYAYDQPSSNTPSWGTLNGIANRKGTSIPSGNPKVADLSSGFPSDPVEHRPEGTTDDFTGTGSYANDKPSSNTLNWISNRKGNSIPSRNPRAADLSSGLPSDSVEHRPEGTTDDFTGTGSYAYDQASSNTPSWGTLNQISNRKGNSVPSRHPKAATISSGFHSDSVKNRPEGTTDDFTGTGSYANDKPSSNSPSWSTLNGIANDKGNSIPSRNPRAANSSPGFPSDSVEHRPEGDTDATTSTGSYTKAKPSSNTPSRGTLNGIANRKGNSIPSRNPKVAKYFSPQTHSDTVEIRSEGDIDDFTGTGSNTKFKPSTYKPSRGTQKKIARRKGSSIPSRNPKASNISPGFRSDSVEHRPDGTTDDFTETGSYAKDKPSSNTPSRGTLNRIANHKGNSIPSRNPKVANISPGFHSDTVEIRPEGTRDDFTATDPNDYKPSANTPSHGTQNEIPSHKGKSIPSRNPEVANVSPGFALDSVKHRPEGTKDDFTGSGSFASGKQLSNSAPWGTQKGTVHLGKHVSKKVARLLKSRPHLLASFKKELKDASDHSSKGNPTVAEGLKPKTETAKVSGPDTDWNSDEPEDNDSEAETDELSRLDTDWDSGEPVNKDSESDTDEMSGSDTDWDSGESEDENSESDTYKMSGSDTDWDSGEPEDEDSESETDKMSGLNTNLDSDEPYDNNPASETDKMSGSDTDWDSGESEDENSESDTHKMSGSDTDWDSGEPEDEDSESETGKMSGSNTNLDSDEPDDNKPASETDKMSGSDTDWDSGEPEDEDSESETDKMSGSNTNLDSDEPDDNNPASETDKMSGSDTDWDSGEPEDEDSESETDKMLGSNTELDSAEPDDKYPVLEIDEMSGSSTNWDSRKPGDDDSESDTDEMSGSDTFRDSGESGHEESAAEADEMSGLDTDWDSGGPEDEDPDSETDKISGLDTDLNSGEPDDEDSESESDEMSGSGTDWDSGKSEDEDYESATGEIPGSDTDLDSDGPENENSESHTDGISRSDTDMASGVPENKDSESETDKMLGSDTELDSGEPDDKNPASEIDEMSGSSTNWDSRKPGDEDSESDTDEILGSDTDWDSGKSENEDSEAEADEMSGLNTDWDSGGPEDEDPDPETDKISGSDTDLDSGGPDNEDSESESDEMSGSDTDWDPGKRDDEDSESATGEIPGSDTYLDTGGPENEDSESHTDGISRSNTDLASGVPEDHDSESETDEMSGSETGLDSGKLDYQDAESDTDEISALKTSESDDKNSGSGTNKISGSATDWDSGQLDDEDSESEKHEMSGSDTDWNSGVRDDEDSESETGEMSGPNADWEYGQPEDKDAESDTHEMSRMVTDLDSGKPKGEDPELETDKLSQLDTDLESGEPEDKESESEPDEMSGSDSELESGKLEDEDSESDTDEMSGSDTDLGSGEPDNEDPESEINKMSGSNTGLDSVVMKKFASEGKTSETKKTHHLSRKISKKRERTLTWPGFNFERVNGKNINIKNVILESLGNQGVHTNKRKKKKSEKESEGAVIKVVITLFFFGALLVVLMMAAAFAFAWPLRKYYQKLSKRVNNRDMESWQDDGDELQSIRVDRNQPQQYYTPCQQEFTPVSYQNPVYSTEPAGAHQFMAGNNGDRQVYSYGVYSHEVYPHGVVQEYDTSSARNQNKTKTRDEVISDDKKRDSRNVERRKIIRQQTSQRRATLTDSLAIAKLIIEGHSKNRNFEKKASERRRVIKHSTSPHRSPTGQKQRSMSFFQELQTGCSVILPSVDHQKSVEKSKARRRTIKDHSAGKRRPSLAEEIADAKKVIVDSERKYEISPAQVKEMTVGEKPRGFESYSYSDILDLLILKNKQSAPEASNTKQTAYKSTRGLSGRPQVRDNQPASQKKSSKADQNDEVEELRSDDEDVWNLA